MTRKESARRRSGVSGSSRFNALVLVEIDRPNTLFRALAGSAAFSVFRPTKHHGVTLGPLGRLLPDEALTSVGLRELVLTDNLLGPKAGTKDGKNGRTRGGRTQ